MAYVCESLQQQPNGSQTCIQWTEQQYVPSLSDADRDTMIVWTVGIFALVFGYRKLMKLFNF